MKNRSTMYFQESRINAMTAKPYLTLSNETVILLMFPKVYDVLWAMPADARTEFIATVEKIQPSLLSWHNTRKDPFDHTFVEIPFSHQKPQQLYYWGRLFYSLTEESRMEESGEILVLKELRQLTPNEFAKRYAAFEKSKAHKQTELHGRSV